MIWRDRPPHRGYPSLYRTDTTPVEKDTQSLMSAPAAVRFGALAAACRRRLQLHAALRAAAFDAAPHGGRWISSAVGCLDGASTSTPGSEAGGVEASTNTSSSGGPGEHRTPRRLIRGPAVPSVADRSSHTPHHPTTPLCSSSSGNDGAGLAARHRRPAHEPAPAARLRNERGGAPVAGQRHRSDRQVGGRAAWGAWVGLAGAGGCCPTSCSH